MVSLPNVNAQCCLHCLKRLWSGRWLIRASNIVVVEVLKIFTIALTRLKMVSFNNFHVGHNSERSDLAMSSYNISLDQKRCLDEFHLYTMEYFIFGLLT